MNRTHATVRRALILAVIAAAPRLFSQTAPAPQPTAPADEEVIELSPFTVSASEDTGYAAKNTIAGTRVRTELKDVGSSISVVTAKRKRSTSRSALNASRPRTFFYWVKG